MTENERKQSKTVVIKYLYKKNELGGDDNEKQYQVDNVTLDLLEELQKYRAIGTVEECREAMERQRAKKPVLNENSNVMFCSVCERKVRRNYDLHCSGCGKAIDWSE